MTHEFLTDEWLEAVKTLRERYADRTPAIPYQVKMNQIISGAPFADGENIHLYLDTTSGIMELEKGQLDDAEVTISTDWDTARAIFVEQDQAAAMQAFFAGKIQVDGDVTKLMVMQATPPDELTKAVAEEIKQLTT